MWKLDKGFGFYKWWETDFCNSKYSKMIILRNNYEMYFLLYVDKELSAKERIAVEEFVLTNMDLKPELDLLLETTMSPDEIVFDEKAGLCKYEITENRLEESMLLYLDNELEASLVEQMDATIIADDKLKREWNILLHTKLDK